MLVANQNNCESNPTFGLVSLHPGDVMSLLEGLVDEQEVEDLLFGLTWVRWQRDKILNNIYLRWSTPVQPVCISRAWAILKLIFWPEPIIDPNTRKKIILRPEPGLLPLLRAGRIEEAVSLARHRLFVSGLKPTMSTFNFSFPYPGNRLAASLLIPVRSLQSFSYLVLTKEKTT
jgi:CRISPR-associated protein Csx17